MRWNVISDTILLSLDEIASHFGRVSYGVREYIIWGASLCPCETRRLSPWSQKKRSVRPKGWLPGLRKKECLWLFFSVVFWSFAALLLLLAPELWRRGWLNCTKPRSLLGRKGLSLRLSTPFPWNSKLGICQAWPSWRNIEKEKSPRICKVSESLRNLTTFHLHHDHPGLIPVCLFWIIAVAF